LNLYELEGEKGEGQNRKGYKEERNKKNERKAQIKKKLK
jgi:hypothetical protein